MTWGMAAVGSSVVEEILPSVLDDSKETTSLEEDILEEILAEAETAGDDLGPLPGVFITFEGGEGAGKTTQLALAHQWLQEEGVPTLATREPGGTPLGQSLRSLLLTSEGMIYSSLTELFLLLADRAQHVAEVIRPSLAEGLAVLCDRYNDSTLAYQAHGGGLDETAVRESCSLATGGLEPHLTLLLDIKPALAMERIQRKLDRMEEKGLEYHTSVRQAFLDLAAKEPGRFVVIDASQPEANVAAEVQAAIRRVLPAFMKEEG